MLRRVWAQAVVLGLLLLALGLTSCRSQTLPAGPGGLVLFHKPTFEFIFPETRPNPADSVTQLTVTATPGETECTSFGVLATRNISGATVQVADLTGPEGTIPASAVDARVAQVWKQKGLRGKDCTTITVPEALLKDDSLNFLDPQWTEDNLPSCPPDAPVKTDLPANHAKQVFLIVTVPADAKAGEYAGTVRVGDPNEPASLQLTVKVLPFKLRGPGRIIGMYYNDNISAQVPLPVYRARLAALRRLGVGALRLQANRDTLEQELTEVKAAGFPGPIILNDPDAFFGPKGLNDMKYYVETMRGVGYDPYIYGVDEPNSAGIGARERHSMAGEIAAFKRIKQVGGLACTAIDVPTEQTLMADAGQQLDLPLYSPNNNKGFQDYVAQLDADPTAKRHPQEGYYFGCWAENPRRNRLMAGYYLANNHMDAVFGWTFYSFHQKGVPVPFDDFALDANKKRWLTVFPTREGCVPTLQSEAFREGVDDLCYLNTFQALALERERDASPAAVDALRRQVQAEVARYRDMGQNKPEDESAHQYTNEQFEESRQVIIDAILKLLAIKPAG